VQGEKSSLILLDADFAKHEWGGLCSPRSGGKRGKETGGKKTKCFQEGPAGFVVEPTRERKNKINNLRRSKEVAAANEG